MFKQPRYTNSSSWRSARNELIGWLGLFAFAALFFFGLIALGPRRRFYRITTDGKTALRDVQAVEPAPGRVRAFRPVQA